MGTFSVEIEICGLDMENWAMVAALVDTGASISSAPASVLRELGVESATKQLFQFAQGETRTMDIGYAMMRFEGREIITQVLFNEEWAQPLLGAMALEGAYLNVDAVGKRLVPVPGLMM